MRKYSVAVALVLTMLLTLAPIPKSNAFVWVVVTEAIKKVLQAMDANIQRLQNKTIALQNAQKALENQLSKLKLKEISEWAEKQRDLYGKYYAELKKVKDVIATFQKVREIIKRQAALVKEYKKALSLFKSDDHFTPAEIEYMKQVYSGILEASIDNLDELFLVTKDLRTTMSDAERMQIINDVSLHVETNMSDLRLFNQQNIMLSVQRAKNEADINSVKKLYGLGQ